MMLVFVYLLLCVLFIISGGLGVKADTNMSLCIEKERQALLDVKANLLDVHLLLDGWGSQEELDCCKWVGVTCNNHTGHVIELDLGYVFEVRQLFSGYTFFGSLSLSLLVLKQLQYLNLDYIGFESNPSPNLLASMSNLQQLHMSNANLSGPIPHQLANLSNLLHLDLSRNSLTGSIPFSFGDFTSLTYLDLSQNLLGGFVPRSFGNYTSLVHLNLSQNLLNGPLPDFARCSSLINISLAHNSLNGSMPDFTRCTSLKYLDLSHNFLNGNMSNNLGHLVNLKYLDVGHNSLKGSMPDFTRCTSLQTLDLSNNLLSGNMSSSVGQLSNLEFLDVGHNSLNGSMPHFRCTSLQILDLSSNFLSGNIPNSVGQLSNLKYLDVGHNSLNGSIPNLIGCPYLWFLDMSSNELFGIVPNSLGQVSNLEYVDFSSNFLEGVITDVHFLYLTHLYYLDMSFNSLALNISVHGRIPSQLSIIKLQSCKLGPRFPMWIETQVSFTHLDISNAGISESIPAWFWDLSNGLQFLNLSSNEIKGVLPNMGYLVHFFDGVPGLDLSNNLLEGRVPSLPMLATLNLSGNRFSGTLSFLCEIVGTLTFLDLSNNSLSGSLPDCWLKFKEKLVVLNLSNNNLSGEIPSSLGFLSNLESLYLRTNAFVGEVPMSLSNCTSLKFVDLRENKLSGFIPQWIGEKLSKLYVLVLGSNKFNGSLPSHICWLYNLQVLDVSNNELSGDIPRCFDNFTAMAKRSFGDDMTNHSYYSYVGFLDPLPCGDQGNEDQLDPGYPAYCPYQRQDAYYLDNTWVTWKGTERSFGRSGLQLLKNIDLSRNNLSGEIPYEITSLYELISLNLSINKLHGEVPKDMGLLKSLESLDMSRNEFSGHIPLSLAQLNFLSYLDLSFNNLSGSIPTGSQLQRFNYTSYSGNPQLCGPPLTQRCGFPPVVEKKHVEEDEDEFWESYYTGMSVGSAVGFLGICGALILNRRWRYFFFVWLSHVKDWIYVIVAVHLGKLGRKFRR